MENASHKALRPVGVFPKPHVQRTVYKVTDGSRMTLEIFWQKGQSEESEKYTLSRI
jgi:hypothetical protein